MYPLPEAPICDITDRSPSQRISPCLRMIDQVFAESVHHPYSRRFSAKSTVHRPPFFFKNPRSKTIQLCRTLAKTFSMYRGSEISRLWQVDSEFRAPVSQCLNADLSPAPVSQCLRTDCHLCATLENLTLSFRLCPAPISQCL